MRRLAFLFATALFTVLVSAGGGHAKGVMGEASINGPGAGGSGGGGIRFDAGDPSDDGFWQLLNETNLMAAVDGSTPYRITQSPPPRAELGPRYTLTWDLEEFEGKSQRLVQYVYPYAGDQSWIFTPRETTIAGAEIPAGWHTTGSTGLRDKLVAYGLPETNPAPPVTTAERAAASEAESSFSYLPIAMLVGLIALIVIASRAIPRSTQRTT